MDTIDDKTLEQLVSSGDDAPVTPSHRAWMNAEVRETLGKKADGGLTYTSLDQVRRDFGLDAR